ncbi:MAG: hypothetical protein JW384_04088 [Nitrosomonadaceae bacterium]|nr:hypothetical protein [Nitrosomonadaceae bacterium]
MLVRESDDLCFTEVSDIVLLESRLLAVTHEVEARDVIGSHEPVLLSVNGL